MYGTYVQAAWGGTATPWEVPCPLPRGPAPITVAGLLAWLAPCTSVAEAFGAAMRSSCREPSVSFNNACIGPEQVSGRSLLLLVAAGLAAWGVRVVVPQSSSFLQSGSGPANRMRPWFGLKVRAAVAGENRNKGGRA